MLFPSRKRTNPALIPLWRRNHREGPILMISLSDHSRKILGPDHLLFSHCPPLLPGHFDLVVSINGVTTSRPCDLEMLASRYGLFIETGSSFCKASGWRRIKDKTGTEIYTSTREKGVFLEIDLPEGAIEFIRE